MEERDDRLELGVVTDPEEWTETDAGSKLVVVAARRRLLLLLELFFLFCELPVPLLLVAPAASGVMNFNSVPAGKRADLLCPLPLPPPETEPAVDGVDEPVGW